MENLEVSFKKLSAQYGSVEIWVNCSYPRTDDWGKCTFEEMPLDALRENMDIHLNSYIWSSRIVANIMKENHTQGAIVNIGSIYGIVGQDLSVYEKTGMKENAPYSAIKGGIANYSRLMASYYGKYDIRVNCLCPGGIFDNQNPDFVKNYNAKTPMNRMGNADEIASAILFLVSEASSYITGTTLMVDGGWTAI